jgi:hypothetical protein
LGVPRAVNRPRRAFRSNFFAGKKVNAAIANASGRSLGSAPKMIDAGKPTLEMSSYLKKVNKSQKKKMV